MALPIGTTISRGIPPDIESVTHGCKDPNISYHISHEQCQSFSTTQHSHHYNPLFTHHLSDGSIVHTTHSNIQNLFDSLQRQLNYHVNMEVNFAHTHNHHTKYTSPQHKLGLHPNPHLINSTQFKIIYDHATHLPHLHSPKTVQINHHDLNNFNSQTRRMYDKKTFIPCLSSKNIQPLLHRITKKNSLLTTRLLYPKTSLPTTFLSLQSPPMPIFKNRLHRTNAIRKLFEDVQIPNLTHANAQILHQRIFSMALKPILPGYHLDGGLSLDDMKQDLFSTKNHNDDELQLEKTLTPDDKTKKDIAFESIIEVARSLLPAEMILDINFPVAGLLGLSHLEAVSLLQNYYETNQICKTSKFYKKRDTTFYLNEIYGILDYIHSEHTKSLSPLITQPQSDDEQTVQDNAHADASLVTPLPPSPSKKRKTEEDHDTVRHKTNIDIEMEEESNNLLLDEMGLLTWEDVHSMTVEPLRRYLTAYATQMNYPFSDSFFQDSDLDDLRETLIIYIIELLFSRSSSSIFKDTTDTFINDLDPIWAYFEYYYIYIADKENNDISLVLLLELDDVRNELKSARDQLVLFKDDVTIVSETNSEDEDVHMFYPGFEENTNVNEDHKLINTMFLNTIQYHKDHSSIDSEDMDRDMTSIIGILRPDEIEMISRQAICFLLQCYTRLGGNSFPISHFYNMDPATSRQEILKIHDDVNCIRTHKGLITDMSIHKLSKRSLKFVSKESGQIILHNHYRNSDNKFRNTYGHSKADVVAELKKLLKLHLKKQLKHSFNKHHKPLPETDLHVEPTSPTSEQPDSPENKSLHSNDASTLPSSSQPSSSETASNINNASSLPPSTNENSTNNDASSNALQSSDLTLTATTTDSEIDNMSRDNAVSEYYRITRAVNKSFPLDHALKMDSASIAVGLKKARDELNNQVTSTLTQFHLTAETTDSTLERLNVAQCIYALTKYCESKQIVPDDAYMRSLTKHQLLIEITKARDVLKGAKLPIPLPPSNNASNKKVVKKNTQQRATKRELAQNLFGVDTDKLDPHTSSETKKDSRAPPKPLKDDDSDSSGHKVAESTREVFTIHAKLEVGSKQFHTPSLVRTLTINLRKGDPLVQIVPVLSKDARPSEKLENEDAIPDDEEKLKKWVENIRTDKSKLYFTMKIRTVNIDHVKTAVYGWCKGKGHWVDFTTLSSIRIFNGGWFHNIHPFYYNRDHFTDYILEELPDLKGKLDIYHKKVFKKNEKNEKISTMAIVIDGDFDVKDDVFNFLYRHKWSGRYQDVSFVPYKSNDTFTKQDQISLMISNNIYQSTLDRLIIKVKDAMYEHILQDETLSFRDWLFNTTIGGKELIKGVEVAPDDVVRVLFHKDDADEVKDAIHNLYPHVVDTFGEELAKQMINEESLKRAKLSSDVEKDYTRRLKEKTGNPQGPEEMSAYSQPKQQRAKGYFGTYLEVARGNQTQTSEITQDIEDEETKDLRSQVKAIAAAQKK